MSDEIIFEEKEPTKCDFCGSYIMYKGSFELVDCKTVFVCVECLKKKLGLGEYGLPLVDDEKDVDD